MSAVVIGIGNRFRRDDGVGPLVLERLAGRLPEGVITIESDGDAARLLDAWEGAELAVIVEAVRHGGPAGALVLAGAGEGPAVDAAGDRGSGTHDLGLAAAIALGRALNRLPGRLVIAGVEPADLGIGEGLSDAVSASLPGLEAMVLDELRAPG